MNEQTLLITDEQAVGPAPQTQTRPFSFTGSESEYFRIWIVNLFLTIVTLGLYSPWAKVRKKQYFYGHTWLDGCNFEYHGNPHAILKGRILAALAFVAYSATDNFSPKLAEVLIIVILVVSPWIIVQSLAFNAANSSYRNLRFRFSANYSDALKAIWPLPLALLVVLFLPEVGPKEIEASPHALWIGLLPIVVYGLAWPYVVGAMKRLQANHTSFATTRFACDAPISEFYGIFGVGVIIAFFTIIILFITTSIFAYVAAGITPAQAPTAQLLNILALVITLLVTGTVFICYTQSQATNLMFNHTSFASHGGFVSRLSALQLSKLYCGNLFAILLSFGLAIPWAIVRTARYRIESLEVEVQGNLDGFVGDRAESVGAAGEEIGDFFGIDVSI